MKKMLVSLAHPDDESTRCAGTIAKYNQNGWEVHLLCATAGQAGQRGKYENVSAGALGAIRRAELADAARILGLKSTTVLDFQDGMLKDVERGELEDAIFKKIVEISPDVVITFDTSGISNHPDHIRMCFATTYAFQSFARNLSESISFVHDANAGKPNLKKRHFMSQHRKVLKEKTFTDAVDNRLDPKLYYATVPRDVVSFLQKQKVLPRENYGKPLVGTDPDRITTVIDISRFVRLKLKAISAHISQMHALNKYLSNPDSQYFRQEYYILRLVGLTEVFLGKGDRITDRL